MAGRSRDDDLTMSMSSLLALPESSGDQARYLVVFEAGSSSLFPLPSAGEAVIGRAPEVDVRLNDSSVSRRHAMLLIEQDSAAISDLGSHNGTRVNGTRVSTPQALGSGDVISLSESVSLVFHQNARPSLTRSLLDVFALKLRLEEELERFVRFQRRVAVLALHFREEPNRSTLRPVLGACLRLIDAAGWESKQKLLAILPELGREEALETAEALVGALEAAGLEASAGLATCPEDGVDVDTLLAGARAAGEGPNRQVTWASDAVSAKDVGGQSILLADPAMLRLYELIQKLAPSDIPVLIRGETGAGKEIAASALHHWSSRKTGPLVTINCAALPEYLVESELFGYEQGAFSGAVGAKPGLFEAAHSGTFFLDEVGDLTLPVQAKLLRVLEAQRVTRLGGLKERSINVRFVAATHRDLDADVKAGRFRQDLYFRINAARLILPPLRDRPRELPLLARNFLDRACDRAGRPKMTISLGAMQAIRSYRWPGNVRELKSAMEYVAAIAPGPAVQTWQLPEALAGEGWQPPEGSAPMAPGVEPPKFRPLEDEIAELEKTRILEALEAAGGVKTHAAQLISVPLRTFLVKLKQYGVAPPVQKRGAK